jgi:hypothetical protein
MHWLDSDQSASNPTGRAFSPVLIPRLSGPSFEAAVVGSASGAAANGPARIYLSPTLMMAEAIGTGDLLAVSVLALCQGFCVGGLWGYFSTRVPGGHFKSFKEESG